MYVIKRKPTEKIFITAQSGEHVEVQVLQATKNMVHLGVQADPTVNVQRTLTPEKRGGVFLSERELHILSHMPMKRSAIARAEYIDELVSFTDKEKADLKEKLNRVFHEIS